MPKLLYVEDEKYKTYFDLSKLVVIDYHIKEDCTILEFEGTTIKPKFKGKIAAKILEQLPHPCEVIFAEDFQDEKMIINKKEVANG